MDELENPQQIASRGLSATSNPSVDGDDKLSAKDELAGYSTVFTNEKAGMGGVDKERVKKVVYEMSKDSLHHENELRKQAKVNEKVAKMRQCQADLTEHQLQKREKELETHMSELECSRDLSQVWLHVDMDAFFAAVEEREDPALAHVPVAVGGIGMISTANYVARSFGVRAAMPGFIALRLCPNLKFVKPQYEKYQAAADDVRKVFAKIDASFSARGLDEASLCITEYCASTGLSPAQVAESIRTDVHATTQLTCSVGIAPNSMLAKICSDINKPNGQYQIEGTREAVMKFLENLSIRKVPGIGRVSEQLLNEFGVSVVSDLWHKRALLSFLFSPISAEFFFSVALGLGSTRHCDSDDSEEARKSVSHERTFAPLGTEEELQAKIGEMAESVSNDLAGLGLAGKCITLKLKQTDFRVRQRSTTLPTHIHRAEDIATTACKLLRAELPIKVRLLGVKVSSLGSKSQAPKGLEQFLRKSQAAREGTAPAQATSLASAIPSVCGRDPLNCVVELGGQDTKRRLCDSGTAELGHCTEPEQCTFHPSVAAGRSTSDTTVYGHMDAHLEALCSTSKHCDQCGTWVEQHHWQEHQDTHFAERLSNQINGPSYISPKRCSDPLVQQTRKKAARPAALIDCCGTPSTATKKRGKLDSFFKVQRL